MSDFRLLLNRASGANQRGLEAEGVRETVEKIFLQAGHTLQSSVVEPDHVEAALLEFIREQPSAIIVGGGDGTVSTAARLLGGSDIAMGVLPMGTFNLAARDLGVPLEIEDAARFLAKAAIHPIDVLDVSGHACLCTTIFGFYPEFGSLFETRDHGGRWWKKSMKLIAGLPRTFAKARPLRLAWTGDGGTGHARTKFSAFVPGRYEDTAGLVPTRTDFSCGTMTAYIGHHNHPASALRGIFDYVLGRQEADPDLQIFKASHLELHSFRRRSCMVMLDGEILQLRFPIHLKIRPGHLRVLVDEVKLAGSSKDSSE